ncbi:unnamed protein product [Diatraea saccharalis]|uniref:FLYWCH-type domain-containing protein n=1 Tax=Diatraea saccharalis TaxID=40085 RepID=A0A9N9R0Z5_9NEOP|nr:unnamed protein product [Diatraea saccharalis]
MAVVNGKYLILHQKYTYSKKGPTFKHWYCSKRLTLQCGAKIKLDDEKRIVLADTNHNHPPPKIYKTSNGSYVTVS